MNELLGSAAKRLLSAVLLAGVAWTGFVGNAIAQQTGVWHGKNGWEILLDKMPDVGMQCMLQREIARPDHQLGWVWEEPIGLSLTFADKNFKATNNRNFQDPGSAGHNKFIVSVDGDVLENRGVGRFLLDTPANGLVSYARPRLLARDYPVPADQWTGPTTEEIFAKLRKGKVLKIETYGVTYTDDLAGVGSALDLFPKCFTEQRRLLDEGG